MPAQQNACTAVASAMSAVQKKTKLAKPSCLGVLQLPEVHVQTSVERVLPVSTHLP